MHCGTVRTERTELQLPVPGPALGIVHGLILFQARVCTSIAFISGNAVFKSVARRSMTLAPQCLRSCRTKMSRPIHRYKIVEINNARPNRCSVFRRRAPRRASRLQNCPSRRAGITCFVSSLGQGLQNHILHFHHPLQFRGGNRSARLHSLPQPLCFSKRTNHVLIRVDRSHANDNASSALLFCPYICCILRSIEHGLFDQKQEVHFVCAGIPPIMQKPYRRLRLASGWAFVRYIAVAGQCWSQICTSKDRRRSA